MDVTQVLVDAARAALGVPAAAYALAAIGINLQFGFTGLLNFGQVGFMLVAAYGTAITVDNGWPLPLGFAVGVLAAVLLGLLLGLPTLRLRADFLAIVTISVAEILRLLARARPLEDLTGGVFGIQGFARTFFDWNPFPSGRYGVGDLTFTARQMWLIVVGWSLAVLATLFVRALMRAPFGRVLKAVREDEDVARSLGKNVFAYKLQSLVAGGVIGAFAGILIALDASFTNPDYWFSAVTFFAYTALIVGGVGSTLGPIIGSMLFWFVIGGSETFLRQAIDAGWFGDLLGPTDAGPIRFALVGLILMLLMIFRPQGILGDRDEIRVIER